MDVAQDEPTIIETSVQEYVYDEDVVVLIGKDGVPKPLAEKKRKYKLVKQENDPMSGERPFNEVENGRIYEIDGLMILIPKRVIDKILHWNENEAMQNDVAYDKKICQSLLVCLTSKDDLANSRITDDVEEFIRGGKHINRIVKYSQCKYQSTFSKNFQQESYKCDAKMTVNGLPQCNFSLMIYVD